MLKKKEEELKDQEKEGLLEKETIKEPKKAVKDFTIKSRFLRIAPRKVRLVANLIKGLPLITAEEQLDYLPKRASRFLKKVLKAARATASHNYNLNQDDLYIKNILVNQGPTLHRYRAAAYGMVHPIRKRSTHLIMTIALKELLAKTADKKSLMKKLGLRKQSENNKKKLIKK